MKKSVKRLLQFPKIYHLILGALIIIAFITRIYFVPTFIKQSGDLRLYADWGEKYWEYGSKEFYFVNDWYYAPPNYPPILSLIYGASYWMFDHKYVLPQIHNSTKLIPSAFIVYFYENGYNLLLKIWGILADLGLGVLIYYVVKQLTNKPKKGIYASAFYLLNPISIFLSGVWGQTDSLVVLLGFSSFIVLVKRKLTLSIVLLFLSLYIKPNLVMFVPLYLFLLLYKKYQLKQFLLGVSISLLLFGVVTLPFARDGVVRFMRLLILERIIPTASIINMASVSAFNFHTIVNKIDYTSDKVMYLFMPANILGIATYMFMNLVSFMYIKNKKGDLYSILVSLFTIGLASFLFLTNMLERYFFAGFVSLVILLFVRPSLLRYVVIINFILMANLLYSFFRRTNANIENLFNFGNFLLLRVFSVTNVIVYILIIKKFFNFKYNYAKRS